MKLALLGILDKNPTVLTDSQKVAMQSVHIVLIG